MQITLVALPLQCLNCEVVTETFVQLARGPAGNITTNKRGVCSCDSFEEVSSPPVSSIFLKFWQQIRISQFTKSRFCNCNLLLYSPEGPRPFCWIFCKKRNFKTAPLMQQDTSFNKKKTTQPLSAFSCLNIWMHTAKHLANHRADTLCSTLLYTPERQRSNRVIYHLFQHPN